MGTTQLKRMLVGRLSIARRLARSLRPALSLERLHGAAPRRSSRVGRRAL
jgi:hypothetical protein